MLRKKVTPGLRGFAIQVQVAFILFVVCPQPGVEHGMQSLLDQLWDFYHQT